MNGERSGDTVTRGMRITDQGVSEQWKQRYKQARSRLATLLRRRLTASRTPNEILTRVPLPFDVVVHFADSPINLYQIRQWLHPLEQLNERHPVVILTRNTRSFNALSGETDLPIINALRVGTIDNIVWSANIKLCLYVNQTARNFTMLRYPNMMHTFLSHGESDKTLFIASNQLKAYDFTFAAGDAAVDRIERNLIHYDVQRRVRKIGRPPLDAPRTTTRYQTERTTVLYAPTWEGDRPSGAYGSVLSHGRQIVESLLGSTTHRLIYRPHPRTGANSASAGQEDQHLRQLVEQAAQQDPEAGHRVDTAPHFGPQMYEADIMITDISADAVDFLVTEKPLIVTRPVGKDALVNHEGMLRATYELPVTRLQDVPNVVDSCINNDTKRQERHTWAEYHFGDLTPGAATRQFTDACSEVIETREKLIANRSDDSAY